MPAPLANGREIAICGHHKKFSAPGNRDRKSGRRGYGRFTFAMED